MAEQAPYRTIRSEQPVVAAAPVAASGYRFYKVEYVDEVSSSSTKMPFSGPVLNYGDPFELQNTDDLVCLVEGAYRLSVWVSAANAETMVTGEMFSGSQTVAAQGYNEPIGDNSDSIIQFTFTDLFTLEVGDEVEVRLYLQSGANPSQMEGTLSAEYVGPFQEFVVS